MSDDMQIEALCRDRPTRQRLDLSPYPNATDAGLAHVVGLTDLRRLNLSGCVHVTLAGLIRVASAPRLERLKLKNCTQLTALDLNTLPSRAGLTIIPPNASSHRRAAGSSSGSGSSSPPRQLAGKGRLQLFLEERPTALRLTGDMGLHPRDIAVLAQSTSLRELEVEGNAFVPQVYAHLPNSLTRLKLLDIEQLPDHRSVHQIWIEGSPGRPLRCDWPQGLSCEELYLCNVAHLPPARLWPSIVHCQLADHAAVETDALLKLPNLRHLCAGLPPSALERAPTTLRSLELYHSFFAGGSGEPGVESLLPSLPSLSRLGWRPRAGEPVPLDQFPRGLVELVCNRWSLGPVAAPFVERFATGLRSLTLDHCTDVGLLRMDHFRRLQSLSVRFDRGEGTVWFPPNLKDIAIACCDPSPALNFGQRSGRPELSSLQIDGLDPARVFKAVDLSTLESFGCCRPGVTLAFGVLQQLPPGLLALDLESCQLGYKLGEVFSSLTRLRSLRLRDCSRVSHWTLAQLASTVRDVQLHANPKITHRVWGLVSPASVIRFQPTRHAQTITDRFRHALVEQMFPAAAVDAVIPAVTAFLSTPRMGGSSFVILMESSEVSSGMAFATALARLLFPSEEDCITRANMNHFGEASHLGQRTGSRVAGLALKIQRQPKRVVLFDAVKEATPEALRRLRKALSTGRLEVGDGPALSLHQTFIILAVEPGQALPDLLRGQASTQVDLQWDEPARCQILRERIHEQLRQARERTQLDFTLDDTLVLPLASKLESSSHIGEVHSLRDEISDYLTQMRQTRNPAHGSRLHIKRHPSGGLFAGSIKSP